MRLSLQTILVSLIAVWAVFVGSCAPHPAASKAAPAQDFVSLAAYSRSGKFAARANPQPSWIWAKDTENHQRVRFRRIFTLPTVPKQAVLYITVDDFFIAYINGRLVDRADPDPNITNAWQYVHHVDVARYL